MRVVIFCCAFVLSRAALAAVPGAVITELSLTASRTVASNRPPAIRLVRDRFQSRPEHVAALLRAIVEDQRPYGTDDARAEFFQMLGTAVESRAGWKRAEWAQFKDQISDHLSSLLERYARNHKQLPHVFAMKRSLDLFSDRDAPYLMQSYFVRGDPLAIVPLLKLVNADATKETLSEFARHLHAPREVNAPLLAYALAYNLGLRNEETDLRRLMSYVPYDVTKRSITSARTAYVTLLRDHPREAAVYRREARAVLKETFTLLRERMMDPNDDVVRRALQLAKPVRRYGREVDPEIEAAYLRFSLSLLTGEHADDFTDVATFLCSDSLSWRKSP